MSDYTYIRLHDTEATQASWLVKSPGQAVVRQVQRGALSDIPASMLANPVIVFVPASLVLLTTASVPTRNRARLVSAVPYTLEDQLADDVDNLHFAYGPFDDSNAISTAIIDRQHMRSIIDALSAAGITAEKILPAQLALPIEQGRWTVCMNTTQMATVRSARLQGFACDSHNLVMLLQRALQSATAQPDAIDIMNCSGAELDIAALQHDIDIPLQNIDCQGEELIALSRGELPDINLLQGEFAVRTKWRESGKRWLPAAALFAVWLVLGLGMRGYDYVHLKNLNTQYQARIEKLYREVFPNSKNSSNPEKQFERKLAELSGGTAADSGFLDLLGQAGKFLQQTSGLEINTLSYKTGQIDVDVAFKDTKVLDALRSRLASLKGLQVEVQSTSVSGDKVQSRLRIKGLTS
jgi:general secretion pathway protein L